MPWPRPFRRHLDPPRNGEGDHPRARSGGGGGVEAPPPAQTWSPGDLAERICAGRWWNRQRGTWDETGPLPVEVRLVVAVLDGAEAGGEPGRAYLVFSRWPERCFDASPFRRIVPRADPLEQAAGRWLELMLGSEGSEIEFVTAPSPPEPAP